MLLAGLLALRGSPGLWFIQLPAQRWHHAGQLLIGKMPQSGKGIFSIEVTFSFRMTRICVEQTKSLLSQVLGVSVT